MTSGQTSQTEQVDQLSTDLLIGTLMLLSVFQFHELHVVNMDDQFTCYPNGTLTVENPDPDVFTGVIATINDGSNVHPCSVSGNDTIVITNCNLTYTITIVFSDRTDVTDLISGGTRVQVFTVKCNEITEHTIADLNGLLGVTLPVTPVSDVTPLYSIAAGFYDDNTTITGSPTYVASVGDTIYFIMTGPVEYYLKPLECIAYNSPSKATATDDKTLIQLGCGSEKRLMEDFGRNEVGNDFEYVATFHVFKFLTSSDLLLECNVRVCPEPANCDISCSGNRRRRDLGATYQGLVGTDTRIATIGRRLRIQTTPIGASTCLKGSSFAVLVSTLIVYVTQRPTKVTRAI